MQDFENPTPDTNAPINQPEPARGARRGLIIVALVVLMVAGGGFVAMIGGIMKSNDAYKGAMARAAADCRVQQALGDAVEAGLLVSGSVETSGPSGHAELSVPVNGSTGSGTLHVVAHRAAEVWSFQMLQLEVDADGQRIDLLAAGACPDGTAGSAAAATATATEPGAQASGAAAPPAKGAAAAAQAQPTGAAAKDMAPGAARAPAAPAGKP